MAKVGQLSFRLKLKLKPRVPKLLRKSAAKKLHLWRKLRSSPDDVSLQCRYHSCVLEWRPLINSAQESAEVKIIDANNLGSSTDL